MSLEDAAKKKQDFQKVKGKDAAVPVHDNSDGKAAEAFHRASQDTNTTGDKAQATPSQDRQALAAAKGIPIIKQNEQIQKADGTSRNGMLEVRPNGQKIFTEKSEDGKSWGKSSEIIKDESGKQYLRELAPGGKSNPNAELVELKQSSANATALDGSKNQNQNSAAENLNKLATAATNEKDKLSAPRIDAQAGAPFAPSSSTTYDQKLLVPGSTLEKNNLVAEQNAFNEQRRNEQERNLSRIESGAQKAQVEPKLGESWAMPKSVTENAYRTSAILRDESGISRFSEIGLSYAGAKAANDRNIPGPAVIKLSEISRKDVIDQKGESAASTKSEGLFGTRPSDAKNADGGIGAAGIGAGIGGLDFVLAKIDKGQTKGGDAKGDSKAGNNGERGGDSKFTKENLRDFLTETEPHKGRLLEFIEKANGKLPIAENDKKLVDQIRKLTPPEMKSLQDWISGKHHTPLIGEKSDAYQTKLAAILSALIDRFPNIRIKQMAESQKETKALIDNFKPDQKQGLDKIIGKFQDKNGKHDVNAPVMQELRGFKPDQLTALKAWLSGRSDSPFKNDPSKDFQDKISAILKAYVKATESAAQKSDVVKTDTKPVEKTVAAFEVVNNGTRKSIPVRLAEQTNTATSPIAKDSTGTRPIVDDATSTRQIAPDSNLYVKPLRTVELRPEQPQPAPKVESTVVLDEPARILKEVFEKKDSGDDSNSKEEDVIKQRKGNRKTRTKAPVQEGQDRISGAEEQGQQIFPATVEDIVKSKRKGSDRKTKTVKNKIEANERQELPEETRLALDDEDGLPFHLSETVRTVKVGDFDRDMRLSLEIFENAQWLTILTYEVPHGQPAIRTRFKKYTKEIEALEFDLVQSELIKKITSDVRNWKEHADRFLK